MSHNVETCKGYRTPRQVFRFSARDKSYLFEFIIEKKLPQSGGFNAMRLFVGIPIFDFSTSHAELNGNAVGGFGLGKGVEDS